MIGSPVFRYALTPGWAPNSLWRAAQAVPSLDLRFAESKSLVDATTGQSLVTFTRASSGTYVGSDGLIKTATTNEPRFDHNPTTGESLGLLVEEQRTNLLLQSENFSITWTNGATTETINAATSPQGTLTADEIVEDTTTGIHSISQDTTLTSGASYSYSCYVKAGQRAFCFLVASGTSTLHAISVNLSTGAATSAIGSPTNISSTSVGNGWHRVAFTYTSGVTGNVAHQVRLSADGVWDNRSYTGNGTGSAYLWGAQLEAGAFPTSYIPTTTATVTRSADVASISGTNFSSWYRQDEGTWLINFANDAAKQGSFRGVLCLGANNTPRIQGNAIVGYGGTLSFTPAALTKAGLAYGLTEVRAVNGTVTSGAGGTIDTETLVDIGTGASSSPASYMLSTSISRLTYWPQRLSNSTLQTLTQ